MRSIKEGQGSFVVFIFSVLDTAFGLNELVYIAFLVSF